MTSNGVQRIAQLERAQERFQVQSPRSSHTLEPRRRVQDELKRRYLGPCTTPSTFQLNQSRVVLSLNRLNQSRAVTETNFRLNLRTFCAVLSDELGGIQ